jgi:protein ImuB
MTNPRSPQLSRICDGRARSLRAGRVQRHLLEHIMNIVARRILCLWFPRLAAERVLRQRADTLPAPFAIIEDRNGAQVLVSVCALASDMGLHIGQGLRDATAICPSLVHRPAHPVAEAAFLASLRRWAGKFTPWVAEDAPDALSLDITGCAHLFGGEAALIAQIADDCAALGISVRAGIASTRGAAWALARFGGQAARAHRNGDAIAQEARATRSRASKRRSWEVMATRLRQEQTLHTAIIAPAGDMAAVLGPLPLAALRLDSAVVEGLHRLGLRYVRDVIALPRAPFARRFGAAALRRLDQALGLEPEPISPARSEAHFATRLSFPDPIGLSGDIEAGLDRLLPRLCSALQTAGYGARALRLHAFRADGGVSTIEVGLARPADHPARIRPLLMLKLDQIDAGFGIDCLRLHAYATEPLPAVQHAGHLEAGQRVQARSSSDTDLDDLIGKLGAKLGPSEVQRLAPAQSHIPANAAQILAAAWALGDPPEWPRPPSPRPLLIFPPEMVSAPEDDPTPPARFKWRGRIWATRVAFGPERIAPEWWFDAPEWRSGPRDYWRVEVEGGERLWLFYAVGRDMPAGWFCEGEGCTG